MGIGREEVVGELRGLTRCSLGVRAGGGAAVRRLRGGVKLAGVRGGAAALFWGVGARSK